MFEESLRTLLLIKWPGVIEAGTTNEDLVSNLNYGETFIDAVGEELPNEARGSGSY